MAIQHRLPVPLRTAVGAVVLVGASMAGGACSDDGVNILALPTPTSDATGTPATGLTPLSIYTAVYDSTVTSGTQTTRTVQTIVQDPPRGMNHVQVLNEYAGQTWFIYDGHASISCSKGRSDAGSCRVLSTNTASPSAVASVGTSSATPQTAGQVDLGTRTIAGRTASCFAYPATPAGTPAGPSEMCFDAEWGVMLYMKAIAKEVSSELIATSVLPTADPAAFVPPFAVVQ